MNNDQALKIATMMLQAARYESPFITLHPVVTSRVGRKETYQTIAKALAQLTGLNEDVFLTKLVWSNGNDDMILDSFDGLTEDKARQLQAEWQNAPVYQDARGRQYIMFNGVYSPNYSYQTIDVERYVGFVPTGKCCNIEKLQKRINLRSDYETLEVLKDTCEIEDIDPLAIRPLYH